MRTILVVVVLVGMMQSVVRATPEDPEIGNPLVVSYLPEPGTYTVSLGFGNDILSESNVYGGDGVYFHPGDAGYSAFVAHLTNNVAEDFSLSLNGQSQLVADSYLGSLSGMQITELELAISTFTDKNLVAMVMRGHSTTGVPEPSSLLVMVTGLTGLFLSWRKR